MFWCLVYLNTTRGHKSDPFILLEFAVIVPNPRHQTFFSVRLSGLGIHNPVLGSIRFPETFSILALFLNRTAQFRDQLVS